MNTTATPSLPSLEKLPYYVVIDGLTGYLCGWLCQVNPYLTTTIFAIRSVANTLLFKLAKSHYAKSTLDSHKIFLITATIVNMTFLITLKELNLIGHLFSCIIGAAAVGYIINLANYVQHIERQSIIDKMNGDNSN